jgi:hypothetical protein
MPALDPIQQIPNELRESVRRYADLLRELGGANAQALVLYGAIAAGSFNATRHTVRSVLVVGQVDLAMLRRLAEHGKKLGGKYISAPLIMTPAYIDGSRDTFPLEFIEIQQNHLVVFGSDPFGALQFDDRNIRLQCERELKVLMLQLRQGLLVAGGRARELAAFGSDAAEGLLRVLRGMLWLKGRRESQPGEAVLREIETLVSRRLMGVRQALNADVEHSIESFQSLYADVEALGTVVDAW